MWFDEFELTLGDSLRRKIDRGLAEARFGLVVLSPRFFAKDWPQRELDGLTAREVAGFDKVILPVWHDVDHAYVARFSPTLADKLAVKSTAGIPAIVDQIERVLGTTPSSSTTVSPPAGAATPRISNAAHAGVSRQSPPERNTRQSLVAGVTAVAEAVRATLGPKGQYVLLNTSSGSKFTRDTLEIAREVALDDAVEKEGAALVREVAMATKAVAGDGIGTSIVLADALARDGVKSVAAGAAPLSLRRGIEKAVEQVVEHIRNQAQDVSGKEQIARVAAISAADDEDIGDVIADAIDKVGMDGVVDVEEGQTFGMDLEFTEGMQFDNGYISPYMVTDQDRMEAVLDYPYILIANQKIGSVHDLLPVLEQVIQAGKPLLIIAEDVEGEALATLVANKHRGTLTGVAVKALGFGDRRKRMLEDVAVLTGGEVITEEMGLKLENTQLSQLGRARRVVLTTLTTAIIDGTGDSEAIKARINQIKNEIEITDSDFDREKLKERLAKIAGGVAVIKVGAATESEMKEKKHRVEDALQATRAALEEGIVPGGGVALLRAQDTVNIDALDGDEQTGATIVHRALEEPVRQLAENSGFDGSVVVNEVRKAKGSVGLNADTGEMEDLIKGGVIDPAMVTRSALENAASVAKNVLSTERVLAARRPTSAPSQGGTHAGPLDTPESTSRESDR